MNHATTLTIGLLAGLMLAPTATRPAPDRIVVEGAEYAGIQPEAPIIEGLPLVSGYAYSDTAIIYAVEPDQDYTIYAFEPLDDGEEDRARTTIDVPVTRENRIDFIVRNRIESQRIFNEMVRGENPHTGPVTYFEIGESVIRVQQGVTP